MLPAAPSTCDAAGGAYPDACAFPCDPNLRQLVNEEAAPTGGDAAFPDPDLRDADVPSFGGADDAVVGAAAHGLVVEPDVLQIRGRLSRVRTAAAEEDESDDEEENLTPTWHQWPPLVVAPAPKRRRTEEKTPDRSLVTKLRFDRLSGKWYVAPNF